MVVWTMSVCVCADVMSDDQLHKQASRQTVRWYVDRSTSFAVVQSSLRFYCSDVWMSGEEWVCLTFCVYLSIKFLHLLSYLLTFLMHIVDLEPVREFFPTFLSPFGSKCKPLCLYVPPGCVTRCWPLLFLILLVFQLSVGVCLCSTVQC